MPFPAMLQVPGTKISTPGTFVEFFNFRELKHFQVTVDLRDIPAGATLELQLYTRDPADTEWLILEPSVTYNDTPNREVHEFAFTGTRGIKLDGKQVGGSPTTYKWWVTKV